LVVTAHRWHSANEIRKEPNLEINQLSQALLPVPRLATIMRDREDADLT
jgi:hypothetical protein